jgi:hypothetical protein
MTAFDQNISNFKFYSKFVIINLGLDPDLEWIRFQQQAVSDPYSAKYLGPDPNSGFNEHGSET